MQEVHAEQAPVAPAAPVNKYARSKIYKIVCQGTDQIYIGSTAEPSLSRRMYGHRTAYRSWKSGRPTNYVASFALFDLGPCEIVLIENWPCNNKDELRSREQFHIDLNRALCVNKCRAIDNRTEEQKKADLQAYYIANREAILAYQLQYYIANREAIMADRAENREANNARILATNSQRIQCACGANILKGNVSSHKRTQKHMRRMAQQQQVQPVQQQ